MEDCGSKQALAKSFQDPISIEKSWAWCWVPVIPARRMQGWSGKKVKLYLQNSQSKKGCLKW
jgi:hypothetical protein